MATVRTSPEELAEVLREAVIGLSSYRHQDLEGIGNELGLPIPPRTTESANGEADSLTKGERLSKALDDLPATRHLSVLARFLEREPAPALRNRIQDLLWSQESFPEINERTRRELAATLEQKTPIWGDFDGFIALLRRLWVLESDLDVWTGHSGLVSEIERHMLRSPGDWDVLDLFKEVGALTCSDRRFALFLEGVLSGSVNPDESRQRTLVTTVTPVLDKAGLQVVETGHTNGFPDFSLVSTGTRVRSPQLIVFASGTAKPDLRLREVLDREVEILDDIHQVLAYDRPVSRQGLTWDELHAWWVEQVSVPAGDTKRSLWSRLLSALPKNSPPQRALFEGYYKLYGQQEGFLALLPEVWLHWDPLSKSARGEDAFLTQRLDFLMFLPGHRRVVLEVDGQQHYSSNEGLPSPAVYAQTTLGDRDLRLSGYEVYRFSGYELTGGRAPATLGEFFDRLLR